MKSYGPGRTSCNESCLTWPASYAAFGLSRAALRPSRGRWQVVVVEDADRLGDDAADEARPRVRLDPAAALAARARAADALRELMPPPAEP